MILNFFRESLAQWQICAIAFRASRSWPRWPLLSKGRGFYTMLKNFRTLNIAILFCRELKLVRVPAHLRDQLLRASTSVPLNCAEGAHKSSARDRKKYFEIALGSLRECQAILALCDNVPAPVLARADSLGAHLYKLIVAIG